MKFYLNFIIAVCLLSAGTAGCTKFLEEKPNKALTVPTTIQDVQLLLDNNERMNTNCPWAGEGSADGYFYTTADFNALTNETNRNTYIWGDELIFNTNPNDWSASYNPVYYANIATEVLQNIQPNNTEQEAWNEAYGGAAFFRAKHLFTVATIWSKAYMVNTAGQELGIPLRPNSNFNETSVRPSLAATFDYILNNAKTAAALLPANTVSLMRPSKPAAYALLARTYLYMQQYDSALHYANLSLQLKNDVLNFNSLNTSVIFPVAQFNNEVIMHFAMRGASQLRNKTDTLLYQSYQNNDLRKTVYFRANADGTQQFRGSYTGTAFNFCGFAVDEMLLTRAECKARKSDVAGALNDLNSLLINRWKTGTFVPFTATDANDALNKILTERRKELVLRDTRWMDIKRLNAGGGNIQLQRLLNNQIISLPPNDNRYALPIPAIVIAESGIPQNPR